MELTVLVKAVAGCDAAVDARCPGYVTRTGREYRAGIGPYPENAAMRLVTEELNAAGFGPCGQFIAYPTAPRQKCDVWLGDPLAWVVEVKMVGSEGTTGSPTTQASNAGRSPWPRTSPGLVDLRQRLPVAVTAEQRLVPDGSRLSKPHDICCEMIVARVAAWLPRAAAR